MKRLTVDQTWEQCLAMYKDVYGRIGTPSEDTVKVMKIQWLNSENYEEFPEDTCFFCEYENHHITPMSQLSRGTVGCPGCPGCAGRAAIGTNAI